MRLTTAADYSKDILQKKVISTGLADDLTAWGRCCYL